MIWVALAVVLSIVVSVITAQVQARILRKQHRRDRHVDMLRQDTVAEKVVHASNRANEKLEEIHVLVNSNMTEHMQAEADGMVRELAMMLEVIELNKAAGRRPSEEALSSVETTRTKIAELEAQLGDRARTQHVVELMEGEGE